MLEYVPPLEVIQYQCYYCRCRFSSIEDHDTHYEEQHKKTGLPFCISMKLPPTLGDDDERSLSM